MNVPFAALRLAALVFSCVAARASRAWKAVAAATRTATPPTWTDVLPSVPPWLGDVLVVTACQWTMETGR